ncbi:hypothetical protein HYFRA_00004098 [Hymenoscyphus fraxineus]|uniref:Uncharacterized protein n=1 Tax=Hymenoscyphus fraxineus TaxID=746836 RepID=A0A9N9PN99_9HELO|nr:hypothetical protein HYFRA_00004098 [Hymenoscyphus fraxineus]
MSLRVALPGSPQACACSSAFPRAEWFDGNTSWKASNLVTTRYAAIGWGRTAGRGLRRWDLLRGTANAPTSPLPLIPVPRLHSNPQSPIPRPANTPPLYAPGPARHVPDQSHHVRTSIASDFCNRAQSAWHNLLVFMVTFPLSWAPSKPDALQQRTEPSNPSSQQE